MCLKPFGGVSNIIFIYEYNINDERKHLASHWPTFWGRSFFWVGVGRRSAELVRQINKTISQVKWEIRQVGNQISQVMTSFWQARRFSLKKVIENASPNREFTRTFKDNDLSQAAAWLFQGYRMVAVLVRQINKAISQVKWEIRQIGNQISQVKTSFWQVNRFLLKKVIEESSPYRESTRNFKDNDLSQVAA
jgi:t-SNARE complex subunit (syntaxin)